MHHRRRRLRVRSPRCRGSGRRRRARASPCRRIRPVRRAARSPPSASAAGVRPPRLTQTQSRLGDRDGGEDGSPSSPAPASARRAVRSARTASSCRPRMLSAYARSWSSPRAVDGIGDELACRGEGLETLLRPAAGHAHASQRLEQARRGRRSTLPIAARPRRRSGSAHGLFEGEGLLCRPRPPGARAAPRGIPVAGRLVVRGEHLRPARPRRARDRPRAPRPPRGAARDGPGRSAARTRHRGRARCGTTTPSGPSSRNAPRPPAMQRHPDALHVEAERDPHAEHGRAPQRGSRSDSVSASMRSPIELLDAERVVARRQPRRELDRRTADCPPPSPQSGLRSAGSIRRPATASTMSAASSSVEPVERQMLAARDLQPAGLVAPHDEDRVPRNRARSPRSSTAAEAGSTHCASSITRQPGSGVSSAMRSATSTASCAPRGTHRRARRLGVGAASRPDGRCEERQPGHELGCAIGDAAAQAIARLSRRRRGRDVRAAVAGGTAACGTGVSLRTGRRGRAARAAASRRARGPAAASCRCPADPTTVIAAPTSRRRRRRAAARSRSSSSWRPTNGGLPRIERRRAAVRRDDRDGDLLRLALDRDRAAILGLEGPAGALERRARDQHGAGLGARCQARGEVRRVAHHGVRLAVRRPDEARRTRVRRSPRRAASSPAPTVTMRSTAVSRRPSGSSTVVGAPAVRK